VLHPTSDDFLDTSPYAMMLSILKGLPFTRLETA